MITDWDKACVLWLAPWILIKTKLDIFFFLGDQGGHKPQTNKINENTKETKLKQTNKQTVNPLKQVIHGLPMKQNEGLSDRLKRDQFFSKTTSKLANHSVARLAFL